MACTINMLQSSYDDHLEWHLFSKCVLSLSLALASVVNYNRKCRTNGKYYKSFKIVIYNRNDNGLYYKTMIIANLTTIVANLASARSVNYDRKVCSKLKCTFTIVNYDPKPFIAQATGCSIIYDHHSDSRGIIYNCNMFRVQATGLVFTTQLMNFLQ